MEGSSTPRVAAALLLAIVSAIPGCSCRRTEPARPAPVIVQPAVPTLVGAGSCTSSGCHAAPIADHAPWQTAYTVWSTRDPHARAHEQLRGPLAERIVAAVAARDPGQPRLPAHEHMACVGCHATARGPSAGEGVSCESCHGPAGRWLAAHTASGWRTPGNRLGMTDLSDPFVCATMCADCHVGGPPTADGALREVTHDLIAAGHPRLAFELRGYKRAEPPHWKDRFAAPPAAAPGSVDEWAQGRLATLASFLRQVESQAEAARSGRRGLTCGTWPEFTAFDCHGCHRPAAAAVSAQARLASPPGGPRLEPMYWTNLDVLLDPTALATLVRVRGGIDRGWAGVPEAAPLAEAIRTVESARQAVHDRLAASTSADLANRIVAGTNAANWAEAVSALAGLEAVADRELAGGRIQADDGPRAKLAELRRLLEFPIERVDGRTERFSSPRGYDAAAIAEHLRAIAEAFTRAAPPAPGGR